MRSNASIKEQPEWIANEADGEGGPLVGGYWTVPQGFLRPSCMGCGKPYYRLKPQQTKGGESVIGPLCSRCSKQLEAM